MRRAGEESNPDAEGPGVIGRALETNARYALRGLR